MSECLPIGRFELIDVEGFDYNEVADDTPYHINTIKTYMI